MFTARLALGGLGSLLGLLLACPTASAAMVTMDHVGPQLRSVDQAAYAHVTQVAPEGKYRTVASAPASITDASPKNRYAVLVAAGTYKESRLGMKPHVDLYGGFIAGDWKSRDVYRQATILDEQEQGPVVIGADDARLDGFVITGGLQKAHDGNPHRCRKLLPLR
jgi:hypothetical protein